MATDFTKEELLEELARLRKNIRFGLVWEERSENVVEQCQSELPVLKEVSSRTIIKNSEVGTNLLIEGDNFHALSVLNYTHRRLVDVIYIDPPYNTGAKDWKYNNHFVDSNDTFRHSKWLSMMKHRLVLAKKLLSKRGVLICTIDDNEQATLGLLLKQLFPTHEQVCVTIVHNPGGIQGKNFSYTHEYAYFVYPGDGKEYISKVAREDSPLTALRDWGKESALRSASKTCFYPIVINKKGQIVEFGEVCRDDFHPLAANVKRKDGLVEIYPIDKSGSERKWRLSRGTVEKYRDELVIKSSKGESSVHRQKRDYRWKTVWADPKHNANVYGSRLLGGLIDASFPYPKSLHAVMDCIKAVVHDNKESIILDYFAGSGTTAHAVMELNKLDGGARKYILATNNENNIAVDVTYPRLKKVMNVGNTAETTGNLRYYKTEFVKKSDVSDDTRYQLVQRSADMICIREGTFESVVDTRSYKIFRGPKGYTAILYDIDKLPSLKRKLVRINDKKVSIYVFSLTNDTYAEDFTDLEQKYQLCPIPESILEVYRRLFKPKP